MAAGTVSSEGGPFLLADAEAVRSWRGAAEGSTDYEHLCNAFARNAHPVGISWRVGDLPAIAWDPQGAGTADVLMPSPNTVLLVRGWFDGDWLAATVEAAGVPHQKRDLLGELEIRCGVLVVLWAPEDGGCVTPDDVRRGSGEPTGDIAISGSSLLVRVPPGRYACHVDQVDTSSGSALRCFVSQVVPSPSGR